MLYCSYLRIGDFKLKQNKMPKKTKRDPGAKVPKLKWQQKKGKQKQK